MEAAGVIQANVVEEKESGARQRPGFNALLKRLQPGDSLTPLFWTPVNPYGRFDLDMRTRITALT